MNIDIAEYVLGFALHGDNALLIRKEKPEWMKGKLNGIGGKIEYNERPIGAMIREFKEEVGIHTYNFQWDYFGCMHEKGKYRVHLFVMEDEVIYNFKQMESEKPGIYRISEIKPHDEPMDNLLMLISMAQYKDHMTYNGKPFEVEIKY